MPVRPTYPGVYIEEVPSGVRTISGVSTSTTAFLGYLRRGPLNEPVQVFNLGDFDRAFGGLDSVSEVSYAVAQYFLNGGTEAIVIRTAGGTPDPAAATLTDANGADSLLVEAANEGVWGDALRIEVDYDTADPANLFNLYVTEVGDDDGTPIALRTETFRNLTVDAGSVDYGDRFVEDVVADESALVRVTIAPGAPDPPERPAQNGTVSGDLSALDPSTLGAGDIMDVTAGTISGQVALMTTPASLAQLRTTLESRLRAVPGLEAAAVSLIGNRLVITAGTDDPAETITFADNTGTLAADLGLDAAVVTEQATALTGGDDGSLPGATELRGNRPARTGLYALEGVDIFNLLSIPETAELAATDAAAVIAEAEAYCLERRAFYLVDVDDSVNTWEEMRDWIGDQATLRHRNAAVYFPRVRIADPLNGYRLRDVAPSGTLAGLYARTDSERGVWKAPAGTEAVLRGVQQLDAPLTDPQNGVLNPLGVNALRSFPVYGSVAWGARTLVGSDQQASDWKYIPVRRLFLFLEESLFRGTKWVVFEPNGPELWGQIRLSISTFLHTLFRQGAFFGTSPREAYFVKCDEETTPAADRDRGIVNILVGVAPLKPVEFVILKFSQMTQESQA